MKGTLLNTATVAVGSIVGLGLGRILPSTLMPVAMGALGLVTIAMGLKMTLAARNPVLVAGSLVAGGLIGALMGIAPRLEGLGGWLKTAVGGSGPFVEGFVTATVLFCVGPMTILGCIEDGLTGRSETLHLKATLDGVAALFFATALGVGILFSALSVLIVQGAITLLARPLRPLRDRPEALAELTGVGGMVLLAIGLGLLDVKHLPVADFLPALVLAPGAALVLGRAKVGA